MSFFGGGTDMPEFFNTYGGSVLSTTFDKYCYVNVKHLPRFFDYSSEVVYSRIERVASIEDIEHPAVRNAMKMLSMRELRVAYEADLPARTGLGTSSSFAVGMLNAFHCLNSGMPGTRRYRETEPVPKLFDDAKGLKYTPSDYSFNLGKNASGIVFNQTAPPEPKQNTGHTSC